MKRTVYKVICTLLLLFAVTHLFAAKPSVAILPFEVRYGVSQSDADALYEIFTTKIIQSKVFTVIERSLIKHLVEEQGFASSDFVNNKDVVKIGELLSSQYVVIGSVSRIDGQYTIAVRSVNVNTGVVEQAESLTSQSISQLVQQIDKPVKAITGITKLGNRILNEWGIELYANAMIMQSQLYAVGLSLGVNRMTSSAFGNGIWGGVNMKLDGRLYPQGGIKFLVRLSSNLTLSANIGVMPSAGVYIKGWYIDLCPLWVGGYDGFNISTGYRVTF